MKEVSSYRILKLELSDLAKLKGSVDKAGSGVFAGEEDMRRILSANVPDLAQDASLEEMAKAQGIFIPYNAVLGQIARLRSEHGRRVKIPELDRDFFFFDILYINVKNNTKLKKEAFTELLGRVLNGLALDYGGGNVQRYELFERSASQQRQNVLVMINKNVMELSDGKYRLEDLIDCGLEKDPEVIVSKYAAYRALMMTSGVEITPNEKLLTSKSVIVLPDFTYKQWKKLTKKFGIELSDHSGVKGSTVVHELNTADNTESVTGCKEVPAEKELEEAALFDGEGLVSRELGEYLAEQVGDRDARSFQIRMPFVKGVVHTVDFRAMLTEIFGEKAFSSGHLKVRDVFTDAPKWYDISDIHMILTKSMFKEHYLYNKTAKDNEQGSDEKGGKPSGAFSYYWQKFEKQRHRLFVSGCDGMFSSDPFTIANYQFLSTLDNEKAEDLSVAVPSVYALSSIAQSPDSSIVSYLMRSKADIDSIEETELTGEQPVMTPDKARVHGLTELIQYNNDLAYNKAVAEMTAQTKVKDEIAVGHIILAGGMRYLSGDLMQLCCFIADRIVDTTEKKVFIKPEEFSRRLGELVRAAAFMQSERTRRSKGISCYYAPGEPVFSDNREGTAVINRNPHLARNEHVRAVSLAGAAYQCGEEGDAVLALYNKYFGHLKGVLMLPMNEQLPPMRLGGADYDGDIVRVFYDPGYVRAATDEEPLPPLMIPSLKAKEKKYTAEERCGLVMRSNGSRVGLFSNHAFKTSLLAYGGRRTEDLFAAKTEELLGIIDERIRQAYASAGCKAAETAGLSTSEMMRHLYQNNRNAFDSLINELAHQLDNKERNEMKAKTSKRKERVGLGLENRIRMLNALVVQAMEGTAVGTSRADLVKLSCMVGLEIDSAKTGVKPENRHPLQVELISELLESANEIRLNSFIDFKDMMKGKKKDKFDRQVTKMDFWQNDELTLTEYLPYIFSPSSLELPAEITVKNENAGRLRNTLWDAAAKKAPDSDDDENETVSISYNRRRDRFTAVQHDEVRLIDLYRDRDKDNAKGTMLALGVFETLCALDTLNNRSVFGGTGKKKRYTDLARVVSLRYGTEAAESIMEKLVKLSELFADEDRTLGMIFTLLPWNHLTDAELRRSRFNLLCKKHGITFETKRDDSFDELCCRLTNTGYTSLAEFMLRNLPSEDPGSLGMYLEGMPEERFGELKAVVGRLDEKKRTELFIKVNTQMKKLHRNELACEKAAAEIAYQPETDFVSEPDAKVRECFIREKLFTAGNGIDITKLESVYPGCIRLFSQPANWQILPAFLLYARASAKANVERTNRKAFLDRAKDYSRCFSRQGEDGQISTEKQAFLVEREALGSYPVSGSALADAYYVYRTLYSMDAYSGNAFVKKDGGYEITTEEGGSVFVSDFVFELFMLGYVSVRDGSYDPGRAAELAVSLLEGWFDMSELVDVKTNPAEEKRQAEADAARQFLRLSRDFCDKISTNKASGNKKNPADKCSEAAFLLEKMLLRNFAPVLPRLIECSSGRFRRDGSFRPALTGGFIDGRQGVRAEVNGAALKKLGRDGGSLELRVSVRPAVSFSGESDEELVKRSVTIEGDAGNAEAVLRSEPESFPMPMHTAEFAVKYKGTEILSGKLSVLRVPKDVNDPAKPAEGYGTLCDPEDVSFALGISLRGKNELSVTVLKESADPNTSKVRTEMKGSEGSVAAFECSKALDEFIWGYSKFRRYHKAKEMNSDAGS